MNFLPFLFALIAIWIAKRAGFFRLPIAVPAYPIRGLAVVGAFVCYLAISLLVVPLFMLILGLDVKALLKGPFKGWVHLVSLYITLPALIGYLFLISKKARSALLWGGMHIHKKWSAFFKSVAMGAICYIVSFPIVLSFSLIISAISRYLWQTTEVKQVAVEQLKKTVSNPPLFWLTLIAVIFCVPFIEELLFRGFLQTWLKKYLQRGWAISLSALVFALVHFAPAQKAGNFDLIISLFVLSCFLGFIYEKTRSLWAPIAMHAIFNGVSALLIILTLDKG